MKSAAARLLWALPSRLILKPSGNGHEALVVSLAVSVLQSKLPVKERSLWKSFGQTFLGLAYQIHPGLIPRGDLSLTKRGLLWEHPMPESIVSFDTIQRSTREAAVARAHRPGEARAALVRRQSEADTALERCQAEATAAAQYRPSDAAPAFSRRLTGLLVNECLRAVEGTNG